MRLVDCRASLTLAVYLLVPILAACTGTADRIVDEGPAQPSIQDPASPGSVDEPPADKTKSGLPAFDSAPSQVIPAGKQAFDRHCMTCHGLDGDGVPGLGVSLVASDFVATHSVGQLVEFLQAGRLPDDAGTIWGRSMPGFAWLPAEELSVLSVYVKNLQGD